jgi:hypothetical protein
LTARITCAASASLNLEKSARITDGLLPARDADLFTSAKLPCIRYPVELLQCYDGGVVVCGNGGKGFTPANTMKHRFFGIRWRSLL